MDYEAKCLSGRHMVTCIPHPSSPTRDPAVMETRLDRALAAYLKETGKVLRLAGWITRSRTGRKKCELHFAVPRGHHVDWKVLKSCLRQELDTVVTGDYAANETVPRRTKLKNSPPHENVLAYVASHADHPDAHVLSTLVDKRAKKQKKRKPSRKALKAISNLKPLFPGTFWDEDEDDL